MGYDIVNLSHFFIMIILSYLGLGIVIGVFATVLLMNWYNPHH